MTDLLIYDTEATDADKRHGQITQFAGIRTNLDMTVVEARLDIRVRPLPWIVPTPEALTVTNMTISQLFSDDAISEFEAAARMSSFLRPRYGKDRVFVTYYGIEFDDELIRRTLYRNLQYAFPTSGKNATRVDMLDGVRLLEHLQPGVLATVFDEEKGKLSWKLDRICPANKIPIVAHDAMGDTEALADLTRLVRNRAPWVWDILVECGNPLRIDRMIADAMQNEEPLFLFTHFGTPDIVPCFPIASDGMRRHVLADLRAEAYPIDIDEAMKVVGRNGTPYPIIKSNLSPIFVDRERVLQVHDFDLPALKEKLSNIKSNKEISAVGAEISKRQEFKAPENQTSEDRIYGGWIEGEDTGRMKRFLETSSWQERALMHFDDDRLQDFSARIVLDALYNGETTLSHSVHLDLAERCAEALSRPFAGPDARWATIASVLKGNPPQEWIDWAVEYYHLDKDWGDDMQDSPSLS
jgi:exodeoxyribonuclease-1